MISWNPPKKAKEKQQLWLIAARLVSFPCCWINDRKSCWPSWLDGSAALLICHFAEERAAQVSLLLIPKCGNWVTRYDAAGSSQKSQNVVACCSNNQLYKCLRLSCCKSVGDVAVFVCWPLSDGWGQRVGRMGDTKWPIHTFISEHQRLVLINWSSNTKEIQQLQKYLNI